MRQPRRRGRQRARDGRQAAGTGPRPRGEGRACPGWVVFCQVVLNKWDYAVLIEPKQRVVDRARGVYRNRARSLSLCAPGSRGGRRGYAHLRLDAAMRREPRRDAAGRAAESGLSGAEAHDPVASRGVFVPVGTRGTTKGGPPPPRPRPRREGLRDRQTGRQGPARPRAVLARGLSAGTSRCASWPPRRPG